MSLKLVYIIAISVQMNSYCDAIFELINRVPPVQIDAPIYDYSGNLLSGSGYLAQLYVGLTPNSLQPLDRVVPFLSGTSAGYVQPATVTSANYTPGVTYLYQIKAWDASFGSTYSVAAAMGHGGVGESSVVQAVAGGDGLPPGPPDGLQSFSLSPLIVPEPSTYALLGLGVVTLGWQCRRRPNS
jgi:hypothetical protein